jgi:hypothetical protein
MKRPSYRAALVWIACNDDCNWLQDATPSLSVSAALMADMFGKDDADVLADLRRAHEKVSRT